MLNFLTVMINEINFMVRLSFKTKIAISPCSVRGFFPKVTKDNIFPYSATASFLKIAKSISIFKSIFLS